jgi:Dehydrogenases with different specificities (related to short-chain alcohol dehydrogenases)
MDLGLKGRVAIVCASSKGLGRAIAEELAAEGASVVMCARGESDLKSAAQEIRNRTGSPVLDVVADVSEPADREKLIAAAKQKFGKIDVLVMNSGGPPSGSFESFTPEMWDAATRLLLTSAVELTRAVCPK